MRVYVAGCRELSSFASKITENAIIQKFAEGHKHTLKHTHIDTHTDTHRHRHTDTHTDSHTQREPNVLNKVGVIVGQ
jgi:acetoacetate decarboxylase